MHRALLKLLVAGYLASVVGCSAEDISPFGAGGHRSKKKSDSSGTAAGDDGAADGGAGDVKDDGVTDGTKKYTKTIDNSGADFQVKDVLLLRSSVESCMGKDMLKVSDEMLRTPNAADPSDGRVRFLLPTQYVAGDDILEKERGNMVDTETGSRTGIAADALTDTYLRSLETVANVVAHNCSLEKEECKCQTTDLARAMLTRCLPGLDPETKEMNEAAEMLGLVCAETEGAKGMRKAIASMLSSYAFASAR